MESVEHTPVSFGPIRALSLALGLTAVALAWLAWNTVTSITRIERTTARDLRIAELRGTIVHLDEVLTMSARMAAATGDQRWEERYRVFDPPAGTHDLHQQKRSGFAYPFEHRSWRHPTHERSKAVELGVFSVSLAVKDLEASRTFYEKFGFKAFAGDPSHHWQILKNGNHVIGLFQGMFEKNILTFNPGWDSNAQKLSTFTDVRDLQRTLKTQGVVFVNEADENTTGPGSFIAVDPDGNPILVDQHV